MKFLRTRDGTVALDLPDVADVLAGLRDGGIEAVEIEEGEARALVAMLPGCGWVPTPGPSLPRPHPAKPSDPARLAKAAEKRERRAARNQKGER